MSSDPPPLGMIMLPRADIIKPSGNLMQKALIFLLAVYLATAGVIQPHEIKGDMGEKIWNGQNATAGQFPYQVLLRSTRNDGNYSACGGSLISTTHVLTAAHCCVNVSTTRVIMGMFQLVDYNSPWVQKMDVPNTSITIHPQYSPKTYAIDICLLKLPRPAQLNANVSVIPIPSEMDTNPSQYDWESATISGWGQTNDFKGIHPILQWSTVTIKPHFLCSLLYIFINTVTNTQICTGKIPWTGSCQGDSGGPLTVKDSSGKQVEIGLVSWGVGSCSSFNPVVFTYVPAYYDWIQNNMK